VKQIIQNLGNGKTSIQDGPMPSNKPGHLLISTSYSVISTGTERMLKSFGQANLINKAKQQPDKVKQTIEKLRTDGFISTLGAVKSKLDQPIPLGYSNVGVVIESDVQGYKKGDRVVSNGSHAEVVCVPGNLCSKIPDSVDDKEAAFTVIASIGLQGVRLLKPSLGESIAVYGLGLIGLIVIQILRANGCNVIAIDNNKQRCDIANSLGFTTIDISSSENPEIDIRNQTNQNGVDGVVITASTPSNDLIHQAAEISRKRGRIILIGDVGLNLQRDDFYKKELTFQVSSSYGPGRYDIEYEEKGNDYPIGFVRWTANRNFDAIIDLLANQSISLKPLISIEFSIEDALDAYELLDDSTKLGILISYKDSEGNYKDSNVSKTMTLSEHIEEKSFSESSVNIGFIGAGNYASSILMPAFNACDVNFMTLGTRGGQSGVQYGKKYKFQKTTTDLDEIFSDETINTIVIATRHDQHFDQVKRALLSGKNIFVEKPLVLTIDELDEIEQIYIDAIDNKELISKVMVGFNRRFSPFIIKAKDLIDNLDSPKAFIMTINSGKIEPDHWTQDLKTGGGRILGEGCHFIDLLRHLAGSEITNHYSNNMEGITSDTRTLELSFSDGSIGTIHYFSNGAKSFPKENLKIFTAGKILEMNNYKSLRGYGWEKFKVMRSFKQDKGNNSCVAAFVNSISQSEPSPIPFDQLLEVSRVSIELQNS
tara:strand:- start:14 stop:2140 length:2127 start_codon:yes stop_codon:yes gene_type:complete